jgi:Mn2+/Fe2+ NRAMP family transporter
MNLLYFLAITYSTIFVVVFCFLAKFGVMRYDKAKEDFEDADYSDIFKVARIVAHRVTWFFAIAYIVISFLYYSIKSLL